MDKIYNSKRIKMSHSPTRLCDKCALHDCDQLSSGCLEAIILGKNYKSQLSSDQKAVRKKWLDDKLKIDVREDGKWNLVAVDMSEGN